LGEGLFILLIRAAHRIVLSAKHRTSNPTKPTIDEIAQIISFAQILPYHAFFKIQNILLKCDKK
jgi:hypothetical protein